MFFFLPTLTFTRKYHYSGRWSKIRITLCLHLFFLEDGHSLSKSMTYIVSFRVNFKTEIVVLHINLRSEASSTDQIFIQFEGHVLKFFGSYINSCFYVFLPSSTEFYTEISLLWRVKQNKNHFVSSFVFPRRWSFIKQERHIHSKFS